MISFANSPQEVQVALRDVGYFASLEVATVVWLGASLARPILVEGPAGTGKTELAKAVSRAGNADLIRLQCYEGIDESKALYEWDYRKQLLRIQAAGGAQWNELAPDLFGEEYLLERPLLRALRSSESCVLLIDEIDRVELDTEALLLEVLSDFQVSIPELGTVSAITKPFVVLTSNDTRELSEALKRRCLYLYLGYPTEEREREIVRSAVPELSELLAARIASVVQNLRALDLVKPPSVGESIDWARALGLLGLQDLNAETFASTAGVALKYAEDIERALASLDELGLGES